MKRLEDKSGNNASVIAKRSFFWNAAYSGISAMQSAIILFAVARKNDISDAGIITMGYALANLVMILAGYGIRNFQVTDTKEEYSFSDYWHTRIITVCVSLAISVGYLLSMLLTHRYSAHKMLVILEIVFLKLTDTLEGLYVGRLQQKGRFDVGSMIATIRIIVSTVVIFGLLWLSSNIELSLLAGIIVSFGMDLWFLPKGERYGNFKIYPINRQKVRQILFTAFPLCVGTTLYNYVGNAPKYLVDYFLTDDIQAVSGYIMMPMFIITLLNGFIMQPTVKTLGDIWAANDYHFFGVKVLRHLGIVLTLSVLVLIAGVFAGLPFFSWIYRIDLSAFKNEFILIMVGGTIYTLSGYLIVVLTTIRDQRMIAFGNLAAVIAYLGLGTVLVAKKGLTGAGMLYIIANVIMITLFGAVLIIRLKKCEAKQEGKNEMC